MKPAIFLTALFLFPWIAFADRGADTRPFGYQSEATGDLKDLKCGLDNDTINLNKIAAARVKIQAESYITYNKDYRGCALVEETPVLDSRRVDFVDTQGGVSRFFVFRGRVKCGGFWGLFPRELPIYRTVQHYSHPSDPSKDRCI